MFDAAYDAADSHRFADYELIFHDYEKTVNQIANQMLRAETERQAREPRDGGNRCNVESELG